MIQDSKRFIDELREAKATVLSGDSNPIKSILSIPRPLQSVQFGKWNLSSVEAGTVQITNRECFSQKITITEELPGFVFESKKRQWKIIADSTLGFKSELQQENVFKCKIL